MALDEEEVIFEKYKLLVQVISNQGNIFWTIFSIFMAANAVILTGYLLNFDKLGAYPSIKIVIPLLGLLISLFWLLISGRDITIRSINIEKAKRLIEMVDTGAVPNLEIWGKNTEIEGKVISLKGIKGFSGGFPIMYLFLIFIYLVTLIWILLILTIWNIKSPYIQFIVILAVIALGASDCFKRWLGIKEFKRKRESERK